MRTIIRNDASDIIRMTKRLTRAEAEQFAAAALRVAIVHEGRYGDQATNDNHDCGYGSHQCFGIQRNHATPYRMNKPLLWCKNLRCTPGASGRLRKAGTFAQSHSLVFEQIEA
jgi:hypothetical protein